MLNDIGRDLHALGNLDARQRRAEPIEVEKCCLRPEFAQPSRDGVAQAPLLLASQPALQSPIHEGVGARRVDLGVLLDELVLGLALQNAAADRANQRHDEGHVLGERTHHLLPLTELPEDAVIGQRQKVEGVRQVEEHRDDAPLLEANVEPERRRGPAVQVATGGRLAS